MSKFNDERDIIIEECLDKPYFLKTSGDSGLFGFYSSSIQNMKAELKKSASESKKLSQHHSSKFSMNPLVSTLLWLIGSNHYFTCPHQDIVNKSISDVSISSNISPNTSSLKISGDNQNVHNIKTVIVGVSNSNLSEANEESSKYNYVYDTNSGTQSPNAGYGFFVSMTPPNDLFPRSK